MTGTNLKDLITQAKIEGISEMPWVGVINLFLRDGTQAERWRLMVEICKEQGVTVASETRQVKGELIEFVVMRPM